MSERSSWPDERIRDEFDKLDGLPEQVATLTAEVAGLRNILKGVLAFVIPVTVALIAGGFEIVLNLTSKAH